MKNILNKLIFPFFTLIFCASGVIHFLQPEFYLQMMPEWMPFPEALNILTGVAEIALGVSYWTKYRTAGIYGSIALLAAFLLCIHLWHVIIGEFPGQPDVPVVGLWIRVVIQLLLMYWLWTALPKQKPNPA